MSQRRALIFCFIVFVLSIGGLAIYVFNPYSSRWHGYYKRKLYQPPRALIVKALDTYERYGDSSKKAIDLGAGIGNEAALALKNGWQVWAIDAEPLAIKILLQRKDIQAYKKNLTPVISRFEELDWTSLPQADLIYAAYALPFCNPDCFNKVWQSINNNLRVGGVFAGHFFGINHKGFEEKDKRTMTFLTKEQVLELFKKFKLEHFEEIYEKTKSATGVPIVEHSFEVIAQKTVY
jgi:tellurite methyltransferase